MCICICTRLSPCANLLIANNDSIAIFIRYQNFKRVKDANDEKDYTNNVYRGEKHSQILYNPITVTAYKVQMFPSALLLLAKFVLFRLLHVQHVYDF